jgi:hypothetical protein
MTASKTIVARKAFMGLLVEQRLRRRQGLYLKKTGCRVKEYFDGTSAHDFFKC